MVGIRTRAMTWTGSRTGGIRCTCYNGCFCVSLESYTDKWRGRGSWVGVSAPSYQENCLSSWSNQGCLTQCILQLTSHQCSMAMIVEFRIRLKQRLKWPDELRYAAHTVVFHLIGIVRPIFLRRWKAIFSRYLLRILNVWLMDYALLFDIQEGQRRMNVG